MARKLTCSCYLQDSIRSDSFFCNSSPPSLLIFHLPSFFQSTCSFLSSFHFHHVFLSQFFLSSNFLSFPLSRSSLFQKVLLKRSSFSSTNQVCLLLKSLSFSLLQSLIHSLTLFTLSFSLSLSPDHFLSKEGEFQKYKFISNPFKLFPSLGKEEFQKKETKSRIQLRHRESEREKREGEERKKAFIREIFSFLSNSHLFSQQLFGLGWREERDEECGSQMIPTSFFFFLLSWRVSLHFQG